MVQISPRSIAERVAIHAALADPHRLAIVDLLALSDRTPSEIGRLLGLTSNLLAHHLSVLASAGLTETVVSSGDRRRRYVRLLRAALDAAETPHVEARSVLFICTHNSARSQLAL